MLDYIILTEEEKNKLYKLCPVDGEFFSMKNISLSHFVLKIESGVGGASLTFEYTADVENKKVWVNVGSFCQLEGEVKHKEGVGYVLGVTGVKKDSRTPDSILRKILVSGDSKAVSAYFFGFFLINNYIKNHLPSTFVFNAANPQKIKRDVFYGGKSKDINKRRRVELCSVYRLCVNDGVGKRGSFSFSCPAWGVRGHYRHLKNGKVVFVRPFVKGKERASMSGYKEKEYVI